MVQMIHIKNLLRHGKHPRHIIPAYHKFPLTFIRNSLIFRLCEKKSNEHISNKTKKDDIAFKQMF
jgi:hypothetical protein